MFMARLCPEISKIENANILFSHKSRKLLTQFDTYNTLAWLAWQQKM